MVNNADSALGHLQFSNGKVIEEYIKEHRFAKPVVNKRICVKFVL